MSAQPASGTLPKRADIEIKPGTPGSMVHSISGALDDVMIEIETVFVEYPADRWATRCDGIKYHGPDKTFKARITRARSCD